MSKSRLKADMYWHNFGSKDYALLGVPVDDAQSTLLRIKRKRHLGIIDD